MSYQETEQERAWRELRKWPFHKANDFVNSKRGDPEFLRFCGEAVNEACNPMMIEATGWTTTEYLAEEQERFLSKSRRASLLSSPKNTMNLLSRKERYFYTKQSLKWIFVFSWRFLKRAYIALVRGRVQDD